MKSKKSSQETTSVLPSPHNKRAPFKFLTRNLQFCDRRKSKVPLLRVKRTFIKRLIDRDDEEEGFGEEGYRSISNLFKNSKIHKTLHHIEISHFFPPYFYNNIKNSKNLQTYACKFYNYEYNDEQISPEGFTFYMKSFPARVKHISFFVHPEKISSKEILKLARCAGRFPNLESFHRKNVSAEFEDKTDVQKELSIYSRLASKLKKMKRMRYNVDTHNSFDFKIALRNGMTFSGITGLEISCERIPMECSDRIKPLLHVRKHQFNFDILTDDQLEIYFQVQEGLRNDDNLDQFTEALLRDQDKFWAWCIVRQEMKPYYSFDLFPALKELSIEINYGICLLGSFVIDGFKSLRNLVSLKIQITSRSGGTTNLFHGLLKLPLLKIFSLKANYLKNEDWGLLGNFISRQSRLESLYLCQKEEPSTREYYLQQSVYIESIVLYLQNKPFLRSLCLKFPFFSVEALSTGFADLSLPNQLHTLRLKASVHLISNRAERHAEGLCQFLKSQKESLRKLHINIPFVFKDEIFTEIAESISNLTQLKKLKFYFDFNFKYITHTFQQKLESEEEEKRLLMPGYWNPSLAKNIQRLENLEKLAFTARAVGMKEEGSPQWLVDAAAVLPNLKKLRKLRIEGAILYFWYDKEKRVQKILDSLKNLKEFNMF